MTLPFSKTLCCLPVLLLATAVLAQQTPVPQEQGFDGGASMRVSGITVPPYADLPFTARVNALVETTLADGTVIRHKFTNVIARDSAGRVHNESHAWVPANSTQPSRINRFSVYDPQALTTTRCYVGAKLCRITNLTIGDMVCRATDHITDRNAIRQSLGHEVIDELEAEGTRESVVVKAGSIGNDRDIVSTKDLWYSPKYRFNLSVVRDDPRYAKQILRVEDFVAGEPDPNLFRVPPGYRVVDDRVSIPGLPRTATPKIP